MELLDAKVRILENLVVSYQVLIRCLNDEAVTDINREWNITYARYLAYAKLAGVLFDTDGLEGGSRSQVPKRRPTDNRLTILGHKNLSDIRKDRLAGKARDAVSSKLEVVYQQFNEILDYMAGELKHA